MVDAASAVVSRYLLRAEHEVVLAQKRPQFGLAA